MSNAAILLDRAAEILESKEWCRGQYSMDAEGNVVLQEKRPEAYSLCLIGALDVAERELMMDEHARFAASGALYLLARAKGQTTIPEYNDYILKSKEEAVAALREAKKYIEARNDN